MRYLCVIIVSSWGLAAWVAQAQLPGPVTALAADLERYQVATDPRRVSSQTNSAGTCTEVLSLGDGRGLLRAYYPSGRLREYAPYADLATGLRHGVLTTWYDSGQLHTRQTFERGQREGELLVYYPDGRLKRRTQYVAGNELPGSCFDPAGQPVPFFSYEQLPLYPGGEARLARELVRAVRLPRPLPPLALRPGSYVLIEFQVREDGRIEAPRVAASSQVPALDQAVLAAVGRLSQRFVPARREGRLVPCRYQLPVRLSPGYPLR